MPNNSTKFLCMQGTKQFLYPVRVSVAMSALLLFFFSIQTVQARAGGGGSGGGSGGSSGGSGGSLGGAIALAGLVAYGVLYFSQKGLKGKIMGLLFSILVIALSWTVLFSSDLDKILATIATVVGVGLAFYCLVKDGPSVSTASQLKKWEAFQPEWNEKNLLIRSEEVFKRFQADWSQGILFDSSKYLSARYAPHVSLMMEALRVARRRNTMDDLSIISLEIIALSEPEKDPNFTVQIEARAMDKLFEGDEVLYEDNLPFVETWHFVWEENVWKLDGIGQATEDRNVLHKELADFAGENNLYYSPDWGYLLLPKQGTLFGEAAFGKSDINNHCLGHYRDTLVQLYSYFPAGARGAKEYVIAQVTVPRSYGTILVRPRTWPSTVPSGLMRVTLEWAEFNKKYEVLATDIERVTSLELLHPGYMERVMALPFAVTIQVVDRTIYLAADVGEAQTSEAYRSMLCLVREAFKELKM